MQKQFFLFKKSRTLVSETADFLAVSSHATRKNLAKAIFNLAKAIFNLAKGLSEGEIVPAETGGRPWPHEWEGPTEGGRDGAACCGGFSAGGGGHSPTRITFSELRIRRRRWSGDR